jgi:ATP-dependent RNA/DNA helicase IGHMBP2
MTEAIKEIKDLISLLKMEQEAEIKEYREKFLEKPLAERTKQGITWYPVVVTDTEMGFGQKIILELERTVKHNTPNFFQPGKVVSLFSNSETARSEGATGIITMVKDNILKMVLHSEEIPDWLDEGKLGLDLYFDERSYKEAEIALNKVINAEKDRLAQLREIILGYKPAVFENFKKEALVTGLNYSQAKAVENVLLANDVAIIHGPPGTGKTTTLIRAIQNVLLEEKQLLVCAPSNLAVDLLTGMLDELGINVLRLGHPARLTEKVLKHSFDEQVARHPSYKPLKLLQKEAVELKKQARKFKRNFGPSERQNRGSMLAEVKDMMAQARKLEKVIFEDILDKASVITCTPVGAAHELIRKREFSTLFFDEGANATAPTTWIPITRAKRVIFAGDHCQLPPTIKSNQAARGGLSVSLFETCIRRQKVDTLLEVQYRMHEDIMNFSSQEFYGGKLAADPSVKNRLLGNSGPLLTTAVDFVDTAGCGYNEEVNRDLQSIYNPEEVNLLFRHLSNVLEQMETENVPLLAEGFNLGIISPYNAQVVQLRENLKNFPLVEKYRNNISIDTVDGFQGQERDIIYISMVRSNDNSEIGFLSDIRRMNVAMTRAKRKLVIIGDSATLGADSFYKGFLDYIDSIEAYKSAWEFME